MTTRQAWLAAEADLHAARLKLELEVEEFDLALLTLNDSGALPEPFYHRAIACARAASTWLKADKAEHDLQMLMHQEDLAREEQRRTLHLVDDYAAADEEESAG